MADVPANLRLITAAVTIDGSTYTEHIQDYNFAPTPVTSEVTDVGGVVHKFAGEAGYVLNLNVFQDFTTTGLARVAFDNEGDTADVTIVDGPVTWDTTVTWVAPTIGGATKAVGVTPLALPCSRPVPTATPAP